MAHVLVVDDEPDSQEFVAKFLERQGHHVSTADDGRAALRQLLAGEHDLVLLDVRMPRLDGVGLLEVMRAYLRWHGLPVIVLSAHATPVQLERLKQMGVTTVFHKASFRLADLATAVDDATAGPPTGSLPA